MRPDGPASSRRVSRRAMLTGSVGAAGVALGAGGSALLRGDADDPGTGVASPGEELMVEHGVLKRVLLAYRAMHERLVAGEAFATGALVDAAQLVADYVESFHEGLEEAYVFPRVAPHEPDLIRTLVVQHDRGRHLTAAIQRAASADLERADVRTELAGSLASFVRMYEPHEAWEDTVVYPALRRVTPQRTLDALAERFADLADQQYGDSGLARILGRVEGVEQQLHIGELDAFTPPAS